MNTEIKAKWLEALRGDKYTQTQGRLCYHTDNSMCCLGVLCDIIDPTRWTAETGTYKGSSKYDAEDAFGYPPDDIMELACLAELDVKLLARRNDDGDSFAEIADYIEANL